MDNTVFSDMKKDRYLTKKDKSMPLDQALLFGTFDLHRKVENEPFVQTMILKTINRKAYASYISQIYFVYKAMEDVGEKCSKDPMFEPVYFPTELNRVEALKEDIKFFLGESWETELKPNPATTRYVERIQYLRENRPSLLLAHHFVRYFGDLSGGQVLKYKMRKCLNLPENEDNGLQFYEFKNITEPGKFMKFYINRMNALEMPNALYDELLEEARNVFQLNIDFFKDLENDHPEMCAKYQKTEKNTKTGFFDSPVIFMDKTWKAGVLCLGLAIITSIVQSNVI